MYSGASHLTLDGKGRIAIPARFREKLHAECGGHVMVCAAPMKAVVIYPWSVWEQEEKRLDGMNLRDPADHADIEMSVGYSDERQIDKQGRLPVMKMLREYGGLEREAVLIGMGKCLELVSPRTVKERQEQWDLRYRNGQMAGN